MILSEDFLEYYFALLIRQYTRRGWGVLPDHEPTLTPGAQRRLRAAVYDFGHEYAAIMLDQMMRGSLGGVHCKRCGLTAAELIALKCACEGQVLCLPRPRVVEQREEDDA